MNFNNLREPNFGRGRNRILKTIIIAFFVMLIIAILALCGIAINKKLKQDSSSSHSSKANNSTESEAASTSQPEEDPAVSLLSKAEALAVQYDYDGAIALLQSDSNLAARDDVKSAITSYETAKSTLVPVNPQDVTHVFFHSLIMDNAKAFDGDKKQAGYNQMMTTKSEFLK